MPIIDITSQPTGQLVSIEDDATYTIAAQKTPGGGAVNYQWQLNGDDLSDGTTTTTVNETSTGKIVFVPVHPDTEEVQLVVIQLISLKYLHMILGQRDFYLRI